MGQINLTQMEMDALAEMGNVGTGNAATALSKTLNKNIGLSLPTTRFVPLTEFTAVFGDPEQIVSGIYMNMDGDLQGEALFIFEQKGAMEMVDIVMGREPDGRKEMDEMDESAFKEIANIVTGAFLNALSGLFDAKILPSVPHIATDMLQALIDFVIIKVSQHADTALTVETRINVEGHDVNGQFVVLFDTKSLERVLEVLHKKYGEL